MDDIVAKTGQALLMALGMLWQTGWSLVLGFTISAILQSTVSTEGLRRRLGRDGLPEVALASIFGAASSSCSYASAAIMRTLLKKGAALTPSLAFLFASTNLVLELGIILYLLLGPAFMAGEWIGGLVLIAIMSGLVRLTYPETLVAAARSHEETSGGHQHAAMTIEGPTWLARLGDPQARVRIAQNFSMEWSMLWKDLAVGFLVGGFLSAFVPDAAWKALFLADAPAWIQIPANAVLGPVVAMLTFVCSIGNVPLAAVLWAGGASFGGVLAFLYADLIVLPLLDAYRRYFGWRMAAYIGTVLFVTMALAGIAMDLGFRALGLIPERGGDVRAHLTHFALNYTFWLNLIFGALAAYWFWLSHGNPMHHGHHHGAHAGHDRQEHARDEHAPDGHGHAGHGG